MSTPIEIVSIVLVFGVSLGSVMAVEAGENVSVAGDAELVGVRDDGVTVRVGAISGRAELVFDFSEGKLDLSEFRDVSVSVRNGTVGELDVLLSATSDRSLQWLRSTSGRFLVRPGQTEALTALMTREALGSDHPFVKRLGNLYAFPWGHQRHWRHMDVSAVALVTLRLKWNDAVVGQEIEVTHPRGHGSYSTDPALLETLEFPILDEFGQLRAGDWPGKLGAAVEFRDDLEKDMALVSERTDPGEGRSRFGGLLDGPKLKSTGFFRAEKLDRTWWLVDPDGYLFWSHGVNCVGSSVETRVTGREALFPEDVRDREKISHYWENLEVKFGTPDWRPRHSELIVARLFDWGLNTIGAWSIPEPAEAQKIPYTLIIHTDMQPLGTVKKIADPFSDAFKNSLDRIMPGLAAQHATSPWLLGVFIDNELDWQGGHGLVQEIIQTYKEAPARVALIEFLRERYAGVAGLNQAWDTNFEALSEITATHGPNGAEAFAKDLDAFMGVFADRYYAVCKDAMRKYFPNHLYLGTRFHVFNPIVTAAASRHCDVISVNLYQHSFENFEMDTDRDRPWMISEFHFGTPDRGVWGVGLTWASDSENQADLYQAYVSDALRHPNIVGTHWFAWTTQTATGRPDGENFGVGLVSLVDRPSETLTDAVRKVSKEVYRYRLAKPDKRIGDTSENRSPAEDPAEATKTP